MIKIQELKEGDIVIEFEGKIVNSSNDLFKLLTKEKIDNKFNMCVIRSTKKMDIEIFPGTMAA